MVVFEDGQRASKLHPLEPTGLRRNKRALAVVKDHAALLRHVARVGNSVVMTGFGHPVGRRVRQPQLSELDINWTNTVHNSKISDLQFKYHLTRLSRVYLGRSALDNLLPYTVVTKPPFYTSPDDLEPPMGAKRASARERSWDSDFILYHPLSSNQDRIEGARGDCQKPLRPHSAELRRLPSLALDQRSADGRGRQRPSSAGAARSMSPWRPPTRQAERRGDVLQPSVDDLLVRPLRRETYDLAEAVASYEVDAEQAARVSDFLTLLEEFDGYTRRKLLDEVREASGSSLMQQYRGTERE